MIPRAAPTPAERLPGWPAWSTSLLLHLVLAALTVGLLQDRDPRRAGDQPDRHAGIVFADEVLPRPTAEDAPASEPADRAPAAAAIHPEPQAVSLPDAPIAASPSPPTTPPATQREGSRAAVDLPRPAGAAVATDAATGRRSAATGGGSRHISGKTTVELFGLKGTGVKFVYLFDRSDSMQGAPIRALQHELVQSLQSLKGVHRFHIIFFNHRVSVWDGGGQRVSFATDANKRAAAQFVHSIAATGGTYRWDALRRALALQPDVVFFLTDTDNLMAAEQVNEAIDRAQSAGITIQSIEFGVGAGGQRHNFLKELAHKTGGQYVYVDTSRLQGH